MNKFIGKNGLAKIEITGIASLKQSSLRGEWCWITQGYILRSNLWHN